MKNRSDLRSLFFLAVIFLFQLTVLGSTHLTALSPWMWLGLFILNICLVFQASAINHNHRHCPMFLNERPNLWVNGFISLIMLAPSGRLHAVHMLNHHTHYKDPENDWSSYKLGASVRPGLGRSLSYLALATAKIFKNRPRLKLPAKLQEQIKAERVLVLFYFVALAVWNPAMTFLWLLPSCTLGLAFLLLVNMVNHDRCALDSEWNHSRNFHSRLENWFLCNNGFHTAHHIWPGIHWSQYPELHRKFVHGNVAQDLEQPSLFLYVVRNYLFRL